MSKKQQDSGKGRASEPKPAPKPVVIYIELPPEKAFLKAELERLGRRHNRKLTGECIQALEEYIESQKPQSDAK